MPTDINSHENKQGIERLAETVVLRRWEGKTCKFGFIKRVYKGPITTVKVFERLRQSEELTLEMSAFKIFHDGNSKFISKALFCFTGK